MDVQIVAVEKVSVGGATDVDARVVGSGSEDQQAEQTDGEATPQRAAVKDVTRVQQRVAVVIGQCSGLFGVVQMFPEEPDDGLDLEHTGTLNRGTHSLTVLHAVPRGSLPFFK